MSIAATTVLALEQSAAEERAASDRRIDDIGAHWGRERVAVWDGLQVVYSESPRENWAHSWRLARSGEEDCWPGLYNDLAAKILSERGEVDGSGDPIDGHPLFERQDGDANRGTLSIDLGTGSGQRRRR